MLVNVSKHAGFGLLEVLISIGISTIMVLAIASMQQNQSKESKAITEKIASLDFHRFVTSELSNFQHCNDLFLPGNIVGGAASLTNLDLTNAGTTPVAVYFNSIAGVALGGKISLESNTALIQAANGIELSIVSPTKANVLIKLDKSQLVRPLRSLSFPLNLKSSGAVSSTTILGCLGDFSGGYVNVTGSRSYGVDYTNAGAGPKFVSVTGAITANVSQGHLEAIVDGATIQTSAVSDANWGGGWLANPQSVSFIVPPGSTYKVNRNLGNISLISWFELN